MASINLCLPKGEVDIKAIAPLMIKCPFVVMNLFHVQGTLMLRPTPPFGKQCYTNGLGRRGLSTL